MIQDTAVASETLGHLLNSGSQLITTNGHCGRLRQSTQVVIVEWWAPMPLSMTRTSLSYLLSCAFSHTGPDLPKSRAGEGKDGARQGICLPWH